MIEHIAYISIHSMVATAFRTQIRARLFVVPLAEQIFRVTVYLVHSHEPKALGKLENIVAETLFPANVSSCFPEWANTRKH
jgi:hypothetical protein